MEQLDEFIQFMMDHDQDDRMNIYKDIKYGHKNYYITFKVDTDPLQQKGWNRMYGGSMNIHVDNRNRCITMHSDESDTDEIVFEDSALVDKWSEILEDYINSKLMRDFKKIVDNTFESCHRKDIARDWKIKKIFKEE